MVVVSDEAVRSLVSLLRRFSWTSVTVCVMAWPSSWSATRLQFLGIPPKMYFIRSSCLIDFPSEASWSNLVTKTYIYFSIFLVPFVYPLIWSLSCWMLPLSVLHMLMRVLPNITRSFGDRHYWLNGGRDRTNKTAKDLSILLVPHRECRILWSDAIFCDGGRWWWFGAIEVNWEIRIGWTERWESSSNVWICMLHMR